MKPTAWGSPGASIVDLSSSTFNNGVVLWAVSGQYIFTVSAGSSTKIDVHATAVLNQWTHVTAVFDASLHTSSIYLNGALAEQKTFTPGILWNANRTLQIGRGVTNDNYSSAFRGSIDEVAMYGLPLSAAAVSTHDVWTGITQPAPPPPPPAGSFAATLLSDSPVGYWRFNESSGPYALDSSASHTNGTATASVVYAQAGGLQDGTTNSAVALTDSNSMVAVSPTAIGTPSSITIEAVVKPTAWGNPGASIVDLSSSTFNNGVVLWAVSGQYIFTVSAGSSTKIDVHATAALDRWAHVTAIFDATAHTSSIYLNGALAEQKAFTPGILWNESRSLQIGRGVTNDNYSSAFRGSIDEVAIYGSALSSGAIATHDAARTPGHLGGPGVFVEGAVAASDDDVAAFEADMVDGGVAIGAYSDATLASLLANGALPPWLLERGVLPSVATFDAPCTDTYVIVPCPEVTSYGYDYGAIFEHWATTDVLPALLLSAAALSLWSASGYVDEASEPGAVVSESASMSDAARQYQQQISGLPYYTAYRVNGVNFDGYTNGVLLEAKDHYSFAVQNGVFAPWYSGAADFVNQATRQLAAANAIPIEWHCSESVTATAIENLFAANGISGISVVYTPSA